MATLVDSGVVLDVVTDDEEWQGWSAATMLSHAAEAQHLIINPLIYAEVAEATFHNPCRMSSAGRRVSGGPHACRHVSTASTRAGSG